MKHRLRAMQTPFAPSTELKTRQRLFTAGSHVMKRITAAVALLSTSLVAFAGTNFNSATGVLVIPDVTIDGKTFFDSATLQLDMSNGTFKLLSYTPQEYKGFRYTAANVLQERNHNRFPRLLSQRQ